MNWNTQQKMTASSSLDKSQQFAQCSEQWIVPLSSPSGGESSIDTDGPPHEIFRFRFAINEPAEISASGITVPLHPINDTPTEELWLTDSNVQFCKNGNLYFSETADYQFCYFLAAAVSPQQIKEQTDIAYRLILSSASERGYAHPVRAWNFFPQITSGTGDDECYRQFSIGRADAFTSAGFSKQDYPAGTAIGTRDDNCLLIVLLSGKTAATKTENPRQISAYDYPRKYGPVSPSFSRASLINTATGKQLLISGTASIVGSDSCHAEDASGQLEETLTNIHTLATQSGWKTSPDAENYQPILRVYLRSEIDCSAAINRIKEVFGQSARIFFIYGDICRKELLLEIESIFWIK